MDTRHHDAEYVEAPITILIRDPCPLGLPEVLRAAHIWEFTA